MRKDEAFAARGRAKSASASVKGMCTLDEQRPAARDILPQKFALGRHACESRAIPVAFAADDAVIGQFRDRLVINIMSPPAVVEEPASLIEFVSEWGLSVGEMPKETAMLVEKPNEHTESRSKRSVKPCQPFLRRHCFLRMM